MKKSVILLVCLSIISTVNAYDYNLNSAMWGNKTRCVYSSTGEIKYSPSLSVANSCCFLLPETGEINLSLDYVGDSANPGFSVYNCSIGDNCGTLSSQGITCALNGSARSRCELSFSTNTGLLCVYKFHDIYPLTSYITMGNPGYNYRNFTEGGVYTFPIPAYGNKNSLSFNGELLTLATAVNGANPVIWVNFTLPNTEIEGMSYFTVLSYNSSDPTDDSEGSAVININPCPIPNTLSTSPNQDKPVFISKGDTQVFNVIFANYSDDIVIGWLINAEEVDTGDLTNNYYSYTPTTSGKKYVQAYAYSPSCNTWAWADWEVYVDPEINVYGTCGCGGAPVQAYPICFYSNDTGVYTCTGSNDDGTFFLDLPPGIYNLSVNDPDYEIFNTTVNISIPPYVSGYPIEQYINIELTGKNITGERVISFKTDGGCDGVYNDVLKNVSFYLYTAGGGNLVLSLINGVWDNYAPQYVKNYSYDETTGINFTLVQGDYRYEVGKSGYYPASNQDNYINIGSLNSQIYGYSQSYAYFLQNLSCSYKLNYTVYTYTYDSTYKINLSGVKLDFYNYFTGAYETTGYSDSTGKYEVNLSEKYTEIRGSKSGYGQDKFRGEILPGDNVSIILKPSVPLRDVSGTIRDCSNMNNVIKGVNVKLFTNSGELMGDVITNDQGKFIFKSIPEGYYTLNYSMYGYGTKKLNITLKGFNWNNDDELCLSFNVNYCRYTVYVLDTENNTYPGIEVQAFDGLTKELTESKITDNSYGSVEFILPRVFGGKGNEIGYSFSIVSEYYDVNQSQAYACPSGVKSITKYLKTPDLIPFDEAGVIKFIENYMWGIFLIILLLFCVYIGVLMARGIGFM